MVRGMGALNFTRTSPSGSARNNFSALGRSTPFLSAWHVLQAHTDIPANRAFGHKRVTPEPWPSRGARRRNNVLHQP